MQYSEKQIEALIAAIFTGKISADNLPVGLYEAIASYLFAGVSKGFGTTNFTDNVLLNELRYNVYLFSGAKTFNYVLSSQILIQDERVISFKEFRELARDQYNLYNKTWLEAEYNTAVGQAQNARAWDNFTDGTLLKYDAVIDPNTSEVCRQLNGIVKPKDDPFWNTHAPENHFRCRCELKEFNEGVISETPKALVPVSAAFRNNPGKSGQVFTKEHPYFAEIPNKYAKLAKVNFNLDLPE